MKIVIIGLGAAGANAARSIAAAGRAGVQVEVYGAEPHLYYARPKLPDFLAGEVTQDQLYFYPQAWYDERHIAVHTEARVARVDAAAHRIILSEGTAITYDRLLVAAGARSFLPLIPGADLPGVFTLRTIDDAERIRAYARGCTHAAVIGGGLLGLEAARGLRALGLGVTVLERGPYLLQRQLDEQGGAILGREVERLGIAVAADADTDHIERGAVVLKSGLRVPADLVLVAAGVRASLELAQASGLAANRGIVVNGRLETSASDVYAAGDVAEFNGTVYGIIPAAIEQAQAAVRNMLEPCSAEYAGTVPSNTLKIVGIDLTSVGQIVGDGLVALRQSDGPGRYFKLLLKDNRLHGAILLGHKEKVSLVTQAVTRHVDVSGYGEALLADGFDWKALLR
ncbi:MAG TPA: FAD-dependent oxidoreductase [Anaerolineae bacterium]|nr:FAD-dependent oxidoreductase [Anaerolineae bacterium]HOQ97712.1 FAD-dependent oxidoreductase [Anaerolineae bacterium]HPL26860.1 FAD-dependent oxidoreductase [Anaerolineae bacterium]